MRAIISKPFAAFSGNTLPAVISFSDAEQATDAVRIIGGHAPQSDNVHTPFAAARLAFSLDAEAYGKRDVTIWF